MAVAPRLGAGAPRRNKAVSGANTRRNEGSLFMALTGRTFTTAGCGQGVVHVFDDTTLDIVLKTLDTDGAAGLGQRVHGREFTTGGTIPAADASCPAIPWKLRARSDV